MKYLFIFLPFFAFGQDTIAFPDGDTLINGQLTYGGDSTLYGIRTQPNTRLDSGFLAESVSYQQLYIEDRSFELIDSFRYNGAYYELRNNGWYKKILPDTMPDFKRENLKSENGVVYRFVEEWTPCNQHFGDTDHPKRDKIEQSEVKLLVWTGCALAEWKATKFIGYNYGDNPFWIDDTVKVKDFIIWYLAGDRWIKTSHVIKEL